MFIQHIGTHRVSQLTAIGFARPWRRSDNVAIIELSWILLPKTPRPVSLRSCVSTVNTIKYLDLIQHVSLLLLFAEFYIPHYYASLMRCEFQREGYTCTDGCLCVRLQEHLYSAK